jgi:biuret amidohydrolase
MLRSARMALIVIDMQRDFLSPQGYAAQAGVDVARLRATIEPVQALITKARACDLPVIFTREGHRPDLSDCPLVKLSRSKAAGAEIGSVGPLGRLLVRGEWGHDVVDEMQVQLTDIMIDKPGYSAFHQTDLDQILRCLQIDTLIVCGVTTEVCVQTTVRAATDFGYFCVTISDACAATEASMQQPALDMLLVEGGIFGEVIDSAAMIGQMKLQSRAVCL